MSPIHSTSSPVPSALSSDEHAFVFDPAIRVGFITPPFKDNKMPVTDHLHAHAYIAPNDLCGWWRSVAYGPLAWYAVDDLVAEIRYESCFSPNETISYQLFGLANPQQTIV